ncbi:MAG: endonuclease domain-containing protein [Chloroflexi bacterium]|nr:endonuclease domain-containing protein [Chloroflexota bacterium]
MASDTHHRQQRLDRTGVRPAQGVIAGQQVGRTKLEAARRLRRESTPAERVLWERIRGHRLFGMGFRRQQIIGRFIVDFYCHAAAPVIEVDGAVHAAQADADAERDAILASRGLRILRFAYDEVLTDIDSVLARIAAFGTRHRATQYRANAARPAQLSRINGNSPPRRGEGMGVGFATAAMDSSADERYDPC